MLNYLHHMLFEPVSAWEKFKFDCLGALVMFTIMALVVGAVMLYGNFSRRR